MMFPSYEVLAGELLPGTSLAVVSGQVSREPLDAVYLQALLREFLQARAQDFFAQAPELSDNERAILLHLRSVLRQGGSQGTVRMYAMNLCEYLNWLGKPFHAAGVVDLEDYAAWLGSRGLAVNTQNAKYSAVKSFYVYLQANQILAANPAAVLKIRRGGARRHTEHVLTFEERDQVLAYARAQRPVRDYLIVSCFYYTGLRASGLRGLKHGDLFRDARGRWWVRYIAKGGKSAEVYLPKGFVEDYMLFRHAQFGVPAHQPAPGLAQLPIFPQARNVRQSLSAKSIHQIVQEIGRAAIGKDISPHWLRHTNITHLGLLGASLEDLQRHAGHENINTTMRYQHGAHFRDPAGRLLDEHESSK